MHASIAVLGASGYSGGELLRLATEHPGLHVAAVSGDSTQGQHLSAVHPHLAGKLDLDLAGAQEVAGADVDVLFSCLPSGVLGDLLDGVGARFVIDLSDEHRGSADWAYGLTEFASDALPSPRVANPGCYPTAVLLALLPFASAGLIEGPVIVDAMSGVSGAGRAATDRFLFSNLHADVSAYGTTEHRHVPEMERGLSVLGGLDAQVSFTPHLVPIARGLLATIRAPLVGELDDVEATDVLRRAYKEAHFVTVVEEWPAVKAVAGSNAAHVHARVDKRNGLLIAAGAIDNLGKGAAGQAIQNANLCLGFPEDAGLTSIGVWP